MTVERKIEYLRRYMDRWVEYYPNYKLCSFEVFCDLEERKRNAAEEGEHVKQFVKVLQRGETIPYRPSPGHYCYYCEQIFGGKIERSKDHIIPISKGGNNSKRNKVVACKFCNGWKSNKDLGEWATEVTQLLISNKGKRVKQYARQDVEKILVNIRKLQSDRFHKTGQLANR